MLLLAILFLINLAIASFAAGFVSAEPSELKIKTAALVSVSAKASSETRLLDPSKDYFFENCILLDDGNEEFQHSGRISILIPHQPRSAKKSDPRLVVCLQNCPESFGSRRTSRQILKRCRNKNNNEEEENIYWTIEIEQNQKFTRRSAQSQSTTQQQDTSSLFSVPPLEYVSYDAIVNRMKKLEKNYPALVQTFTLQKPNANNEDYKTSSGSRSIWGAKLSSSSSSSILNSSSSRIIQNDPRKQEIVVIGGMHAREWIAGEVSVGLLESLANLFQVNENARNLIDFFEFIFVPVLNPDGYEHSRSIDRYWRKNRRQLSESNPKYFGVDLNRNFPYQWGQDSGSSGNYWEETFRGPSASSEIETQATIHGLFRNRSLVSARPAFVFSLHSYGGSYLIPPGYASNVYTPTYNIVQPLLSDSVKAIFERIPTSSPQSVLAVLHGSYYSSQLVVQPAWQLYPVSGDMIDWIHFEFGQMPCSTIELRPTNSEGCCGFELSSGDIPPSVMEQVGVLLGTIDTIKFVIQEKIVKNNNNNNNNSSMYDPQSTYWWRKLDDQSNVSAIFTNNMSQIFADKKNTPGWPTLESYFEPTNAKSSPTSPSVQYFIGPLLRYQNQLREKTFALQNSNGVFSPWIAPNLDKIPTCHSFSRVSSSRNQEWFTSSNSSSSSYTKETFASSSTSSLDPSLTSTKILNNSRWNVNLSSNLRAANSTVRSLWRKNSPSLVDFSVVSSNSLSTLPLNILLQESSDATTSICQKLSSMATLFTSSSSSSLITENNLETASIIRILLNEARIGYSYQQENSCPGEVNYFVEPKQTVADLMNNILPNSTSSFFEAGGRNFSISFAPLSFGSKFDDNSSLCTLQIRFKINFDGMNKIPISSNATSGTNNNISSIYFYSDVAMLNRLAVDFCDLLTNSMDRVVWSNLSCNFQKKAPGNGSEADNAIVGVQVQLLEYDENILFTSGSGRVVYYFLWWSCTFAFLIVVLF